MVSFPNYSLYLTVEENENVQSIENLRHTNFAILGTEACELWDTTFQSDAALFSRNCSSIDTDSSSNTHSASPTSYVQSTGPATSSHASGINGIARLSSKRTDIEYSWTRPIYSPYSRAADPQSKSGFAIKHQFEVPRNAAINRQNLASGAKIFAEEQLEEFSLGSGYPAESRQT